MTFNIRSGAIRWQIPDFMSDRNNILIFPAFACQNNHLKFDLENVGQGNRLQHSQWQHSIYNIQHSMANISLYKSHTLIFFSSSLPR